MSVAEVLKVRRDDSGALWCKTVYAHVMGTERPVRRSVSLPPRVARRVKALVKSKGTSENHVIVGLIESGLEAKEREKARFFEIADRLAHARDAAERAQLKEEQARLTFGE